MRITRRLAVLLATAGLLATTMFVGVVGTSANFVSPLGCVDNGIALTIGRTPQVAQPGDVVTYTVNVRNGATASAPAPCDVSGATVTVDMPSLTTGLPSGSPEVLATNWAFPADGGSPASCAVHGATFGVNCGNIGPITRTFIVPPGPLTYGSATAQAALSTALLHSSDFVDDFADTTKQISAAIVDANIQITPSATNKVGDTHTFTAHVNTKVGTAGYINAAGGTVITFTKTGPGTLSSSSCTVPIPVPPAMSTGSCSITDTSLVPGVDVVNASATRSLGGLTVTRTTNAMAGNSGPATKTWVDARITIAQSGTNKVGDAHTFTVTTSADFGDGAGFVATPGAITGTSTNFGTITGGSCTVANAVTPCTIVVSSTATGVATVNADATVTVGGVPIAVSTSGYGAFAISNVKTWVDARITIAQSGTNKVGDAHTFTVTTSADFGDGAGFVATPGAITGTSTNFGTITAGSCTVANAVTPCTIVVSSTATGVATVNADATVTVGGVPIAVSTSGYGAFAISNVKTWVDARITIAQSGTNKVGDAHTFTVTTSADFGDGAGFVATPGAITGTSTNFGTITGGSCTVANAVTPCTIVVSSTATGVATVNADATVTVGGVPIAVSTSGYGAFAISNVKTWVDARITIAQSGTNKVGDAHTFTVTTSADFGDGAGFVATPGAITGTSTNFGTITGGSCTVANAVTPCTIVVSSTATGVATVNADATVTVGGVPIAVSTSGYGAFAISNVKTWVDARITIAQSGTNKVGDAHTFTVTTSADFGDGAGFVATPGAITGTSISGLVGATITGGTCLIGATTPCTIVVSSTATGVATVQAEADVVVGGVTIHVATNGYGAFAISNQKTWVDARIGIGPNDINQVNDPHTFTVHVDQNDGTGWAPAAGVTITGTKDFGQITGGTCVTSVTDAFGECTVIVNSSLPGTIHVTASGTVTVGGVPIAVSTSGYGVYVNDNTKTYVDAQITIAQSGTNKVGDEHTFTVSTKADFGDGAGFVATPGTITLTSISGLVGATITGGTCLIGATTPCTIVVSSTATGVATVQAEADVVVGGVTIHVATNGYGAFAISNQKTWVDAQITIAQSGTNKVGDEHTFTVSTKADFGDGAGFVATPGTITLTSISGLVGATITGGTCLIGATTPCTIVVSSTATGVATVQAEADVVVGGVTIHVATNGYGAFAISNQKTWVDAQITIAQSGVNPVRTSHTFTVTTFADPGTGTFVATPGAITLTSISGLAGASIIGGTCTVGAMTPCTIVVYSDDPGTATVQAEADVTVGGVTIHVATNGYGAFDISNEKTWVASPAIDIEKATNAADPANPTPAEDADSPTGPFIALGAPVTWTYIVTNTGNVTLTSVTVTDDKLGAITCPKDTLSVGESMICIATGSAGTGQYANLGSTSGIGAGQTVTDSDPSHYFGSAPTIDLEKHTNGQDADSPTGPFIAVGGAVLWEYIVTNTGNVALQDVVVTDDQGVTVTCPQTTLAVAESMTCTATGTAVAGQYANLGTVTGQSALGQPVTDSDPSHYFGSAPTIDLEKHTNGQDADSPTGPFIAVGGAVLWEYIVTNTGNVALQDVVVTDDQGVTVTCPQTTLAVAESMTCTATGTAVAGQYANLGTVTGQSALGQPVTDSDPSHYFGSAPTIDLEKHTNGQDADSPTGPFIAVGGAVLWEYIVTNTGNVALQDVVVTDDQGVTVTCPQTTLAVAESMTCTATGTAVAGQYANLGTVTGQSALGQPVTDSDPSHYFGSAPTIDLEKHTNGQDADSPTGPFIAVGGAVLWEYIVTNTGNVALQDVVVTDDQGVTVTCPQTTLAVAESMTCTATGTAVAGQYANLGTVTGQSALGQPVTDSDPSHYFGSAPTIDLEKHTNGQDADSPTGPFIAVGGAVLWEYIVTNTGNVALQDVVVTDDQGVTVTCPQTTLAVAESMTCTATGTAVAGQYANLGTVTGQSALGQPVTDSDPSHYFGSAPTIDLEKHTNGQDADSPTGPFIAVGGAVLWEYIVTNTGNVALQDVVVTDDQGVTVTCPQTTLAVAESMTCTATGTAVAGQYANLGTVTGQSALGQPVTDSDPSHYFGSAPTIDLEKHTNGQDADSPTGPFIAVGGAVLWEYIVTNTGNVALQDVVVTDDQGVTVTCPQTTLAVAESMTCTATGTAVAGQYANLGTVTGQSALGQPVTDSDPSHYFGSAPTIDLEKHTNGQDADSPTGPFIAVGGAVLWEYIVTNTGNVALQDVVVTDDQGVTVTCPQTTLAVAESMTCTATGTAVAGQYANLGTVTGQSALGQPVTDSDPSHYFGSGPAIDIEKATNAADPANPTAAEDADSPTGPFVAVGSTVTWTYLVTNTGNVALQNVAVTDDQVGAITCPKTTLAVGESMICTKTGAAIAGQYGNEGTVTGESASGQQVTDKDPSHYFGSVPTIDIEKHTNGEDADAAPGPTIPVGGAVTWTYIVTNTGNVALQSVAVTDDKLGAITCPKTTLAVGEAMTCTATGTAVAGQYANLGTVTGESAIGQPVTDTDPSHYFTPDVLPCPAGQFDFSMNANGDLVIAYDQFPAPNDNSYGVNAVGWGTKGHKFGDLVGSDKAGFLLKDMNGVVKLSLNIDYLVATSGTPSGYTSAGPFGGDGSVLVGSVSSVWGQDIAWDTSLSRNLNGPRTGPTTYGPNTYFSGGVQTIGKVAPTCTAAMTTAGTCADLLVNSPKTANTINDYSLVTPNPWTATYQNPEYANVALRTTTGWNFHDTYFLTIKASKLASLGLTAANGWSATSATVAPNETVLHNSPAKPCPVEPSVSGTLKKLDKKVAEFTFTNTTAVGQTLTGLGLAWPQATNGNLLNVKMGGVVIWNTSTASPLNTNSLLGTAAQRTIAPGASVVLQFNFANNVNKTASNYTGSATFNPFGAVSFP